MKFITEEAAAHSMNALAYQFAMTHKNDYDTIEELADKATEFAKSWFLRYCESENIIAVQCDDDELDDELDDEIPDEPQDEEQIPQFDNLSELLGFLLDD